MYNALSRKDEAIVVRVPVNTQDIFVMNANMSNVPCQVIIASCDLT